MDFINFISFFVSLKLEMMNFLLIIIEDEIMISFAFNYNHHLLFFNEMIANKELAAMLAATATIIMMIKDKLSSISMSPLYLLCY